MELNRTGDAAMDRRHKGDRRTRECARRHGDRRHSHQLLLSQRIRAASLSEQVVQFLTRYLFWAIGIVYFNGAVEGAPSLFPILLVNAIFGAYLLVSLSAFAHAYQHHVSKTRYRLMMWADIAMVSVAVLNDPYVIPPSLLIFIMVALGNGMRYGLRLFAEAVTGCFAAAMLVMSIRHAGGGEMTPGLWFLNLFGGAILVYAYVLMARVEKSRSLAEHASCFDPLTGLLNRGALHQAAEMLFDEHEDYGTPVTVLFADMDHFKRVNDEFGHARGDEVLTHLSKLIRAHTRDSDLAGRYGGDEFVIVLRDADLDQAEPVARRIQNAFNHWAGQQGLACTITVGLGEVPHHGHTLDAVLNQVDKALYEGKSHEERGKVTRLPLRAAG